MFQNWFSSSRRIRPSLPLLNWQPETYESGTCWWARYGTTTLYLVPYSDRDTVYYTIEAFLEGKTYRTCAPRCVGLQQAQQVAAEWLANHLEYMLCGTLQEQSSHRL
jgi:hypothetical protein